MRGRRRGDARFYEDDGGVSFDGIHADVHVQKRPVQARAEHLARLFGPVKLTVEPELDTDDLLFLLANDSDEFNRWEAAQKIATSILIRLCKKHNDDETLKIEDVDGRRIRRGPSTRRRAEESSSMPRRTRSIARGSRKR